MLDETSNSIPLKIHLKGDAFSSIAPGSMNLDLFVLGNALLNLHGIFDRSYAVQYRKKNITGDTRKEFKIVATKITPGSLDIDALLAITPIMPSLFPVLPATIFEIVCKALELSNIVRRWLIDKGEVRYNQPINVNGDNNTINVINMVTKEEIESTPEIINAMVASNSAHTRLMRQLDENALSDIEISSSQVPTCKLNASSSNKYLYEKKSILSDTLESFDAKIFELNTERNGGSLRLKQDDNVYSAPVPFEIIGSQNLNDYISALTKDHVSIRALVANHFQPPGVTKIARLHISKIDLSK